MIEDKFQIITYKGKEVWIADYSNTEFEESLPILHFVEEKILSSGRKDILLLDIVSNIKLNSKNNAKVKEFAKTVDPYLAKYAVVGVAGLIKAIATSLKIFNLIKIRLFDTKEEALEYLIS